MRKLSKPIQIKLLDEASRYFDEMDEKIKIKFFKSFDKIQAGYTGDWFKHLDEEIWEFRERDSSKFYRIFAFWDSTQDQHTLIIGTHGLDKKTNKTPRQEIEKAKRSMKLYFEQKKDKL